MSDKERKEKPMEQNESTCCPRCGGAFSTIAPAGAAKALSRTDNNTTICSDCGVAEAGEDAVNKLTPQSEWGATKLN